MFCKIVHMEGESSWKAATAVAVGVFILLICVFSAWKAALAGHSDAQEEDGAGGVSVVATVYPLYVMLLNITAGTDTRSSLLLAAGAGCLHDWQLTTADMKALQAADIVVASGAGMEGFLDKVLEMKAGAVVTASEGFPLLDANSSNPHIWLSSDGAAWQVRQIATSLAASDSANATLYMNNCERYTQRLEALGDRISGELSPFATRKVALFHEALVYLAHEAGLDVAFVLSEEELSSPSAKRIREVVALIDEARDQGDEIVCFADATSAGAVRVIEQEAHIRVWQLDTCTAGELSADAYIAAMEGNIAVMKSALSGL